MSYAPRGGPWALWALRLVRSLSSPWAPLIALGGQPSVPTAQRQTPPGLRILFVAANPALTQRLCIDGEFAEIGRSIGEGRFRDEIALIPKLDAIPDDLLAGLNEHSPQILHFSGHGAGELGLLFCDGKGGVAPINKRQLLSVLAAAGEELRLVFLDACDTNDFGPALTTLVDCAVVAPKLIQENVATMFAKAFYRAIASGRSVRQAFDQGCAELVIAAPPVDRASSPVLLERVAGAAAALILAGPHRRA